jgi:hypothetical protein
LHVAVPFFFKHAKLAAAWGRGFVFCTNMRKPGECGFIGTRRSAKYLAKYLGKAFEESALGRHRYERAQGFSVVSYRVRRWDMDDGQEYAEAVVFRAKPGYVWRSEDKRTGRVRHVGCCSSWHGRRTEVQHENKLCRQRFSATGYERNEQAVGQRRRGCGSIR